MLPLKDPVSITTPNPGLLATLPSFFGSRDSRTNPLALPEELNLSTPTMALLAPDPGLPAVALCAEPRKTPSRSFSMTSWLLRAADGDWELLKPNVTVPEEAGREEAESRSFFPAFNTSLAGMRGA
jgi:hypothetical protein